MKRKTICLIVALTALCACTHNWNTHYLDKAEQFNAAGRMDSMLYYLRRVDSTQVQGEERYTFQRLTLDHTLFLNRPKDNLRILGELTEHYVQRKDTARMKEMTDKYFNTYLQGGMYAQADSIASDQLAEALRRNDRTMLRRNHYRKYRIFEKTGQTDSAVHYLKLCLHPRHEGKNHAFYYQRLADLYLREQRFEEGEAMLDSAIVHAKREQDNETTYALLHAHSDVLSRQGRYTRALEKMKESYAYRKRSDMAAYNMQMASYYEGLQQPDSAARHYQIVTQSGNTFWAAEAHLRLARLHEKEEAAYTALYHHRDALKRSQQFNDNYLRTTNTARYQELELRNEINELKMARQQQIIVILSLAFALLAAIGTFLTYHLHKKRKEAERTARMESERLKQAEEYNRLTEKVTRLREELVIRKMNVFKKLPSLDSNTEEEKGSDRRISLTDADWQEIRNVVDSNFNNFSIRLRQEFPLLSNSDIHFCCLIKINVSVSDISNIFCISRTSVSRRKLRIKEKLNIPPTDGITLDQFIQQY